MLVMKEIGMNRLLGDKFTIGGEAAAAAGPVGRETSANTDVLLRAEILSWSRSRGLFAGLSLEGATLRPDSEEKQEALWPRYYEQRDLGIAYSDASCCSCIRRDVGSVLPCAARRKLHLFGRKRDSFRDCAILYSPWR
jgi:hypothetical protein